MTIRDQFALDPDLTFLNHGSFGACPRAVLQVQAALRERMERDPVRFLASDIEGLIDGARAALAAFIGADPESVVFVPNATTGVNAILRSLVFAPGDEVLVTDHGYNACRNALEWVAARSGARVVVARIPFPLSSENEILEPILSAVTERTRLALVDHVTSPTGLVFPIRRIVAALEAAGVDVLVDGAHAPGMLPIDVGTLDAAYYVGNCHKWLSAPKAAGFIVARPDRREGLIPHVLSHGWNDPRDTRSRFHLLFDWVGTIDPSAMLCVPAAIQTVGEMLPGGWPEVRAHNHQLALAGRALLLEALGVQGPAPEALIGSLVSIPVGPGDARELYNHLYQAGIQVPVFPFGGQRIVRISAAIYNTISDVRRLAAVLPAAIAPS